MRKPPMNLLAGVVCALVILAAGGCSSLSESSPTDNFSSPRGPVSQIEAVQTAESHEVSHRDPTLSALFLVAAEQPTGSPGTADVLEGEQAEAGAEPGLEAQDTEDEFYDPFAEGEEGEAGELEEYDPWEPYNAVVFDFNYNLDKYLIKPVAKGYNYVTPDPVQRSVKNFFQNVRFVPRMINNLFQGKFKGAGVEFSRFLINTTIGLAGFFDPAKNYFELETPSEDFGQTLGYYGMGPGPYLLIPFWPGPLTVRDGVGVAVDMALDPINWLVLPFVEIDGAPQAITDTTTALALNWGTRVIELLNERSLNLETFQGVEEATVDLYGAVRNGYLQKRAKAIRE